MRKMVLAALALTTLAACGAGPGQATQATTATSISPATTDSETTMSDQDQIPIVAPAIEDLARRLRVSTQDIQVVSAEEVTWPDGSLGCPKPGMSYTQALVDGSQVVLGFEDRVYVYHAGSDGQPFLCQSEDKDGGHDFVPPPGFNS